MTQPIACIRCHGTELVPATLDTGGTPRVVVDAAHSSPIAARVCLACGAVMLTATEVGKLRVGVAPDRAIQEYDF